MPGILDTIMNGKANTMSPQEMLQLKQMDKETPGEFSDLLPPGKKTAKPAKNTAPAKQSVRSPQTDRQYQQLIKLLVARGMTQEEAEERAKSMGFGQ